MSDRLTTARRYGAALGRVAEEASRAGLDRVRHPAGPLPLTAGELTPDRLAAAIGLEPGQVEEVSVISADRGSADRARIGVRTVAGVDLPPTFYLKLTPSTLGVRLWSGLGCLAEKEVHFYQDATPSLTGLVPRCFGAAFDRRTGRSLVVLEDLAIRGCRFPTVATGCTADEAHTVARTLGAVHRVFWASPRFEGDLAWFKTRRNPWTVMEAAMIGTFLRRFPGRYNAAVPEEVRQAARVLIDRPGVVRHFLRPFPRTLIHNDSHLGNMYFDGSAAGLFDWQEVSHGPPVHDVGYFLSGSLDPEVRRACERDVLGTYLDALGSVEGAPSAEQAWTAYRAVAATAFTASVYTASFGDRLQSEPVVVASLEHAVAAVRDLETFELLATAD